MPSNRIKPRHLPILALGFAPALVLAPALAGATGDPDHGALLFKQSCALCHASGLAGQPQAGQGPSLAGVVGRLSGSLENFSYTKALQGAHITWTPESLDRYLAGPIAMVPGTTMAAVVANPQDRADLIAFLATLRKPESAPTEAASAAEAAAPRGPGDWQNDAPGIRHRIRIADLPAPYATKSAGNQPRTVDRPGGAALQVPAGFQVKLFTTSLSGPRLLRCAPNGDIFVAETHLNRIHVLRAPAGADAPTVEQVYAEGLEHPFGIAFYPAGGDPQWLYVGCLNAVVRFPYRNGDLEARGKPEIVVPHLSNTTGGHMTRDVAFSADGRRMFISVGSGSNVADGMDHKSEEETAGWAAAHALGAAWGSEEMRANILVTDPEPGGSLRVFASGIRNAVGIAVQPGTGILWCSVNERDELGDDLVPDYITHVDEGGFYGWPWYYLGDHEDPRLTGARPDLKGRVSVPDVPVQSHSATLEMTFYPEHVSGPSAFPPEYRGQIFAAFHGSWNRTHRTGSKLVHVFLKDGVPSGEYEDFLTGFVLSDHDLWGRPVGVTVARDGALLVTDDANNTVWRISTKR